MAQGSMQVSSLLHHRRILTSDVSMKRQAGVLSVGTAGCVGQPRSCETHTTEHTVQALCKSACICAYADTAIVLCSSALTTCNSARPYYATGCWQLTLFLALRSAPLWFSCFKACRSWLMTAACKCVANCPSLCRPSGMHFVMVIVYDTYTTVIVIKVMWSTG